ncbi:hypothetical protein ACWDRX_35030, partial [Streptomyces nigra]
GLADLAGLRLGPGERAAPAALGAGAADDAPGWPSAHFTEIIDDLADHAQVILYSQFWRVDTGRTYGGPGPGLDWELDWIDRADLHPER